MQEMTVDSIRVSLMNYQRVVILREKDSDRYLPIWIGPAEADAIALEFRLHDSQIHKKHLGPNNTANEIFRVLEQSRIEAKGSSIFKGIKSKRK